MNINKLVIISAAACFFSAGTALAGWNIDTSASCYDSAGVKTGLDAGTHGIYLYNQTGAELSATCSYNGCSYASIDMTSDGMSAQLTVPAGMSCVVSSTRGSQTINVTGGATISCSVSEDGDGSLSCGT